MWKETPQNSWSNDSRTQFSRIRTVLDSSVIRRWRTLDLVWVLYFLVCDHTIKRGSRVSSLTQIKLTLGNSHTCSNSAQDCSKKSRKYLETQKVEEAFNSKSMQPKTDNRLNWCSGTGSTEGHRITPTPCLRSNLAGQWDSSWKNLYCTG